MLKKGVKNAVIRRSIYEFNLHLNEADLRMVQRILYFREMDHELLAEHEIDYCVLSCIDRPFAMNENEIEGNEIFLFFDFSLEKKSTKSVLKTFSLFNLIN